MICWCGFLVSTTLARGDFAAGLVVPPGGIALGGGDKGQNLLIHYH